MLFRSLLFVIFFFAVLVVHHGVSRADKALVVGDAVERERHKRCRIFVQSPCDPPQQEQSIHWIVKGVSVVPGCGAEDSSLAGSERPKSVAAHVLALQNISERCAVLVGFGTNGPDDLDIVACEQIPIGLVVQPNRFRQPGKCRMFRLQIQRMIMRELAPLRRFVALPGTSDEIRRASCRERV